MLSWDYELDVCRSCHQSAKPTTRSQLQRGNSPQPCAGDLVSVLDLQPTPNIVPPI